MNIFLKLPTLGGVPRAPGPVVDPTAIPGLPDANAPAPVAPAGPVPTANTRITLTLSRIPLLAALGYVAQQAGLKVKIEAYAVSIVPLSENTETMITAEFRVPPTFISNSSSGNVSGSALNQRATSATGGGGAGTRDNTGTGSGPLISRQDAQDVPGIQRRHLPGGRERDLPARHQQIGGAQHPGKHRLDRTTRGAAGRRHPPGGDRVQVRRDHPEQPQGTELRLDARSKYAWRQQTGLLRRRHGTGSDIEQNLPFSNAQGGTWGSPLTSGNRSGSFAIQANAIDALLFGGGASAAAPGIFSLAGVFTDPQFQLVVRALNQQKGVDLAQRPSRDHQERSAGHD